MGRSSPFVCGDEAEVASRVRILPGGRGTRRISVVHVERRNRGRRGVARVLWAALASQVFYPFYFSGR